MLVLVLINDPCLENVVNFGKRSNSQNHWWKKKPLKQVSENKTILKKFRTRTHECYKLKRNLCTT